MINNSVIDKTIGNLKNTVDVRLVTISKHYQKLVTKPNFVSQNIFNNNLVVGHNNKLLIFNEPAYVDMCLLGLSKTSLYDFHYSYIKTMIIKLNYYLQTMTV